jgi:hypothetical protein
MQNRLRNKYTTFSSIRIIALRSVDKIFRRATISQLRSAFIALSMEEIYHATSAVTRGLGIFGLIRRAAQFSRPLRDVKGCGGSTLTRVRIGPPHPLASRFKEEVIDWDGPSDETGEFEVQQVRHDKGPP